jgi:hypothetical protein
MLTCSRSCVMRSRFTCCVSLRELIPCSSRRNWQATSARSALSLRHFCRLSSIEDRRVRCLSKALSTEAFFISELLSCCSSVRSFARTTFNSSSVISNLFDTSLYVSIGTVDCGSGCVLQFCECFYLKFY